MTVIAVYFLPHTSPLYQRGYSTTVGPSNQAVLSLYNRYLHSPIIKSITKFITKVR